MLQVELINNQMKYDYMAVSFQPDPDRPTKAHEDPPGIRTERSISAGGEDRKYCHQREGRVS